MSHDRKFYDTVLLILGFLVGIAVVIYFVGIYISKEVTAKYATDDAAQAALLERIKPVGVVAIAGQEDPGTSGAPAANVVEVEPVATALSGPQVYNAACVACHGAGVAGAPKLGDSANWGPRIARGNDVLRQHAVQGYQGDAGYMPPKGGRTDLSDEEIHAAVDYIVSKSQ